MKDGWDGITSEGFGLVEGYGLGISQDLNPIRL